MNNDDITATLHTYSLSSGHYQDTACYHETKFVCRDFSYRTGSESLSYGSYLLCIAVLNGMLVVSQLSRPGRSLLDRYGKS